MAAIDWEAYRRREAARLGLNFKPFQPYVPVPPPGTYDPSLNAQRDAATRGYEDVQQDTATGSLRAAADLGIGREALTRSYNRGNEDLTTGYNRNIHDIDLGYNRNTADIDRSYGRSSTDLGTARSRGIEDYDWQVGALQRGYKQLERRQDEGARRSGVLSGGLALQSAAARAENMAFDRHPMDVQQTRFLTDNTTQRGRLTEDYGINRGRLTEDWTTGRGRLGDDFTRSGTRLTEDYNTGIDAANLAYSRGEQDRLSTLARAGRENQFFGQDVAAQKLYEAAKNDWTATYPKGEGVTAAGTPYRTKKAGGYIWSYDQKGNLISRRKA